MTQPTLFQTEVLPLYEKHRPDFLSQARFAARAIAKRLKRPITINDVRKVCPVPDGVDPRVCGAVFADREVWEPLDYVASPRRTSHGRPVREFRLRDANEGRRAEEAARSVFAGEGDA